MLALFQSSKRYYRAFHDAPVDHVSFHQTYTRCDLKSCEAMCCYQGAPLDINEAKLIEKLIKKHTKFFAYYLDLSQPLITYFRNKRGEKRAQAKTLPHVFTRRMPFVEKVKAQRCVFLDEHSRCLLQVLSAEIGEHPWFYKPSGCWLHPIRLMREDKPEITILQPEDYLEKGQNSAQFAPFTCCGAPCAVGGDKAYIVFSEELKQLGRAMERDLCTEIKKGSA
jgi:Fe-S-cluster containining protein